NDSDAGAGTDPGWDLINITAGLTINASPGNKFTIWVDGHPPDFLGTSDYVWTIVKSTTGITGFDPAAIEVTGQSFPNPGNGLLVVETANAGNDLVLRFVHTPAFSGPENGTAECGSIFNLNVSASGTPPLAYQWKHAGTNIPGANGSSLNVTASSETAGSYVVEVSNAYGTNTGAAANLTVQDTTAPNMVCAPNATVECGAVWNFTEPTANDTCSGNNVTITVLSTVTNTVAGGYTVTRTWEAKDPAN